MSRSITDMFADWGVVKTTPEMERLVEKLRANERELHDDWQSIAPETAEKSLWELVSKGVKEARAWRNDGQTLSHLCERALKLRGGLDEGPERKAMRERARVLLHVMAPERDGLQTDAHLMSLWNEATRLEPLVRLNIDVPRWRTTEDWLPFTGMSTAFLFDPIPLTPGAETADPNDIPALIDELLTFINTSQLAPEIIAAHSYHLLLYIHPFVDGNGHTTRMLLCDLLMRAGFGAPTLVSHNDSTQHHRGDLQMMMRSVLLGKRGASELVSFHLHTLLEAQARLIQRS